MQKKPSTHRNIKAVDFKNGKVTPKKKTAPIDFTELNGPLRYLQDHIHFIEELKRAATEGVKTVAGNAGVSSLVFVPTEDTVSDILHDAEAAILMAPDMEFVAEDEDYEYTITFEQDDDFEDDDDDDLWSEDEGDNSTLDFKAGIFRKDKKKAAEGNPEPYEAFYTEKKSWVPVKMLELFGMTPKQMSEYCDGDWTSEADLWSAYTDEFGPVDDRKFEKIKKENAKLIELAQMLPEELAEDVWFDFTDRTRANLMASGEYFGMCVQYADNGYCVKQYITNGPDAKPKRAVFSIKDAGEMAKWLEAVYCRKFMPDLAGIIPLSRDALLFISDSKCHIQIANGRECLGEDEKKLARAAMREVFGEEDAKRLTDELLKE